MKTQIAIYTMRDWAFKTEQGQEMSGSSIYFHLEGDFEQYGKCSAKDEVLNVLKKVQLPALFDADLKVSVKNGNIKYEINSLKFLNSFKVF